MTTSKNRLDQEKDIAGSYNQNSSLDVSQEPLQLGEPIVGQSGGTVSIIGVAPNLILTDLAGMSDLSIGRFITLSGGASIGNNGTFLITDFIDPTSVIISNSFGVPFDANNGLISWVERKPYSLQDDLNYARSDRANIKGTPFYDSIPTYIKCNDQNTPVPANLSNIAGHTTDAKAFVDSYKFDNLSVTSGDLFVTLISPNNLKHADAIDITGVPIYDGYDSGNDYGTFVVILNKDGYATEMTVDADQVGGALEGWRIFGRTRAGSSSSPDSVEIEFRAVELGADLSLSVPYVWESTKSTYIDIILGYRTCLHNISENAFRKLLIFSVIYGGQASGSESAVTLPPATEYGQFLYSPDGISFVPAIPIVTEDEGMIIVDDNGKIIVIGGA